MDQYTENYENENFEGENYEVTVYTENRQVVNLHYFHYYNNTENCSKTLVFKDKLFCYKTET